MLITFHAPGASDVVMLGKHAQQALALCGKRPSDGGIPIGELAHAIQALETAVVEGRQHAPSQEIAQDAAAQHTVLGEHHFHEAGDEVSFAAHVFPLLELMRAAREGGAGLTWE